MRKWYEAVFNLFFSCKKDKYSSIANAKIGYGLVAGLVILIDRLSKVWALKNAQLPFKINTFLSFNVTMNRGMSWGIFNSESTVSFVLVTCLVIGITLWLLWYARQRVKRNKNIFFEMIVIAGSISNIMDRFEYKGVVDFIVVSLNSWSWPAFNVADTCIVCGALMMLIFGLKEK